MKAFKALIPLLAVSLLVACTKEVAKKGTAVAGNVPTQTEGTGDWGGGNGTANKVFESYIVDVTTLPEFKEDLAAINKSLSDATHDSDTKADGYYLNGIAQTKTWFIAPVSLEVLEKGKLGVEFSKDPVEQLALQTENEIWIDAKKYNLMSQAEKSKLLLHEIMMIAYRTRFQNIFDMCKKLRVCSEKDIKDFENDIANFPKLQKKMAPEPKRPLTSDDYQNIRGATGFLLIKHETLKTGKDIDWFFASFNFDQRMKFSVEEKQGPLILESDIKISEDTLLKSITETSQALICGFNSDFLPLEKCRISGNVTTHSPRIKSFHFQKYSYTSDSISKTTEMNWFTISELNVHKEIQICPSGKGYCTNMMLFQFLNEAELEKISSGDNLKIVNIYFEVASSEDDIENGIAKGSLLVTPNIDTIIFMDGKVLRINSQEYSDVAEIANAGKVLPENIFSRSKPQNPEMFDAFDLSFSVPIRLKF